jgi:hypothetical protein
MGHRKCSISSDNHGWSRRNNRNGATYRAAQLWVLLDQFQISETLAERMNAPMS